MTQRFNSPVSRRRRRFVSALPAVAWLGASGSLMPGASVLINANGCLSGNCLWTGIFNAALAHGA